MDAFPGPVWVGVKKGPDGRGQKLTKEEHMKFFIRFEMAFERETAAQTLCRTIFNAMAKKR